MADCKDIDAALARLSSKVDELNRKQKECCDNKDKNQKDIDLSDIKKRLNAIEAYINKLDEEIKLITTKVAEIGGFLGDILSSLDGIVGKVFSSIITFTKLFSLFK